jgi:hypothetical protein
MPRFWCDIIKNHDRYSHCQMSYKDGIYSVLIQDYESTAIYQVEIGNQFNPVKPGVYDITGAVDTLTIIKVTPADKVAPNPCGERVYFGYRPKSIFSLTDLPRKIQSKVREYLLNRTGDSFYKRLQLNLGQELDTASYYAINPNAKAHNDVPPAYSLCMSVLDTLTHEEIYSFRLNLARDGKLIDIVKLPDIKHNPSKSILLSKKQINEIAKENNIKYPAPKGYYESKIDSIVWKFDQPDQNGEGEIPFTILRIDAHTGAVLSRDTEVRMVNY